MRCAPILYGRTLSKDYRWLVLPSRITLEERHFLKAVYDSFDVVKDDLERDTSLTDSFYCWRGKADYLVFRCGRSLLKDMHGRRIYVLEGLLVDSRHSRHLQFVLPALLEALARSEVVLSRISENGADDLDSTILPDVEVHLDDYDDLLAAWAGAGFSDVEKRAATLGRPVELMFGEAGLRTLKAVLLQSAVGPMQFAFGSNHQVEALFRQLEMFARWPSARGGPSSAGMRSRPRRPGGGGWFGRIF